MFIKNSRDGFRLIRRVASTDNESLWVIGLNEKLKLKDYQCLSKGDYFNCPVPTNQVLKFILNCKAKNFILIHNHPNGILFPSENDLKVTEIFKLIGEFISIPLIDHIIISKNSYRSFLDEDWCEFG